MCFIHCFLHLLAMWVLYLYLTHSRYTVMLLKLNIFFENVYFYGPANHLHFTGNQYNEARHIFTACIQEECEVWLASINYYKSFHFGSSSHHNPKLGIKVVAELCQPKKLNQSRTGLKSDLWFIANILLTLISRIYWTIFCHFPVVVFYLPI